MTKGILGLIVTLAALNMSSTFAAPQFPITCQNSGGYPQIVEYFNLGRKAGYDVFKTPDYVEATVTKLRDAKLILTRLCVEKAAQERQ